MENSYYEMALVSRKYAILHEISQSVFEVHINGDWLNDFDRYCETRDLLNKVHTSIENYGKTTAKD